jgi:hypothetical protein
MRPKTTKVHDPDDQDLSILDQLACDGIVLLTVGAKTA